MQESLSPTNIIKNNIEKKAAFNVEDTTNMKSKTISHVNGNNGEIGKEKRHRRSKNDPEGRKYVCDICQKSYLSPPALSSHRKNKHFQNEEKKNRGRPIKYPIIQNQNEQELKYYLNFFYDPKRAKKPDENFSCKETVLQILKKLKDEEKRLFKNDPDNSENNNLYLFISDEKREIMLESADDAFARYIIECHQKSSQQYFEIIVKFIIFFRDFMNNKNMDQDTKDTVYCINNGAVKIPDSCNDFITDVSEKGYYGLLDIKDCIDLIQHFCYWLHKNKYTKAILSLLEENN